MFTITIFELESLRNVRPVTNISDDTNDFEFEITNHNSTPPKVNEKIIKLRKLLKVAQAFRWRTLG